MKLYLLRVCQSKKLYPCIAHVFAIEHYKPLELGEDDFSKKLMYFYKYGNDFDFFLRNIIDLYDLRFKEDSIRFDYITLYPTREKGKVNPIMEKLVKEVSKQINIPYKQLIRRNRNINPNHELKKFEERAKNVEGSMDILEDVEGKNIIIFDNTSTTGISLIDVTNLLIEKGANNVVCICLGLSYKYRESDWDDLNKTLKYSRIKDMCKSPFISQEKREKWKKEQQGC